MIATRATIAKGYLIIETASVWTVIAQRTLRRKSRPSLPRPFNRLLYKLHNVIERLFSWLKEKRQLCTRLDKLVFNRRS
ncbi:transposase [Pseudomonas luteola]